MAYYLGIDGGGSKTTCAVGDETALLAQIAAGPSNITRVGEIRARESLQLGIRDACAAAQIDPRQIDAVCAGSAGAGRREVASSIRKTVAELIPGQIEVVGDMEIAMEAAFGAGPGVIVVAGTGSIAYGRNGQGVSARAGGWGFAISDEGSAHWTGRAAVSSLLQAIDQRMDQRKDAQSSAEELPMFRSLRKSWSVRSLDEFVRTANSTPDFATLFPAIVTASDAGDSAAQAVLAQAGAELSRLAGIVIGRLFKGRDATSLAVWLSMAGGVFRHSARVRNCFHEAIRKLYPHVSLNPQVVEPVLGALQMARKAHTGKSKD